ncbi:MAG: TonB-dependent receptor [Bacteroidetes bacterium]|nr:TonB-dependent receptor [Bacteroidota bacterium]
MLAVAYNCAQSQQASSLHGKVQTGNGAPADAATVVLLKSQDSSVVQSSISSKEGLFGFSGIAPGSYLIFVTQLNYNKVYSGPYSVSAGQNTGAGTITLKQAAKQLAGITITGKKDFVEVHPDKTVLNVDQNIMAAGSSLYDVLITSPGVKINNSDILYHGGQKALIAIDGKPVLLSGDELVNFLKNYQSSSISQIELIDNPGPKYEASTSGGMINIILKKNTGLGSNFSISQSAGLGDDYRYTTGLIYTLRTEKLNLFASYGFQDSKVPHTISNSREITYGGQVYTFDINYLAHLKMVNNNFSVGADYQLAKGQTIGFLVNGFYNNMPIDKANTTTVATNGQLDSSINTQSSIARTISNMSYDLNYKGNLDKAGHSILSGNADYVDYHRHSNEMLQNVFVDAAGQNDGNAIFYQDISPSHIMIKSANLDFTQQIAPSAHFDAGVKSSSVNSDNNIDFNQLVSGSYQPVPDLTDHFIYDERIDAAYFGFQSRFNKTTVSFNLRDEHTSSSAFSVNPNREVDSSYNNLFPSVSISQQLDKSNLLTAFYRRNIHRPDYQDLNPFVGYVDTYYHTQGNPFLKPAYINTYEVSDLINDKYKVSLMEIVTDNFFATAFEQDNVTKVYTSTKINLGSHYQYQVELELPVDIANWWNISATADIFHEKYTYTPGTAPARTTNGFNVYLNQSIKLSKRLNLQLYDKYESASYYIISDYRPLFYMSAGLSYSILNNKGSLALGWSDIFNTDYNRYHTDYANLNITERDRLSTRMVQATFKYHFGRSSPKVRSSNTDEQKRLGEGTEN